MCTICLPLRTHASTVALETPNKSEKLFNEITLCDILFIQVIYSGFQNLRKSKTQEDTEL